MYQLIYEQVAILMDLDTAPSYMLAQPLTALISMVLMGVAFLLLFKFASGLFNLFKWW